MSEDLSTCGGRSGQTQKHLVEAQEDRDLDEDGMHPAAML